MILKSNVFPPFKTLPVIWPVLLCLMISACSSRPKLPSPEQQAEKLAQALDDSGYKPTRDFEISSVNDIWRHDQVELEVAMIAPTKPGAYPLIIYLPSLGEDVKAGRLWRENWAKAGYAVFSIQPVSISQALKDLGPQRGGSPMNSDDSLDDQSIEAKADDSDDSITKDRRRSLRMARDSDLRYLGHQYFAVEALKNRMDQLFWAYQQLKIKAGMKQSLYGSADVSKVILAGYDLGAQTVTAVLGENFNTTLPNSIELKPLAAIVLSPSIDLAEGNARNRFQALNLPILVITGSEDNDPYAISSASVRTGLWEDSPSGDKYLLLLKGGGHRLLSGSGIFSHFDRGETGGLESRRHGGLDAAGQLNEFSNQFGGHGRNQQNSNDEGMLAWGSGNKEADKGERAYKQVAAVISTTLAFLDVVFKKDEFARFWLRENANIWLDKTGSIKVR
ncbi:MAG: hypothetical protein M0R33_18660 [Methylomonas sp.]|jgi:hypothetical protein|uniref:hypothetical protein n=1 Tax=Methylomonas sp. TaxID=418 RepID=UPI0025FDC700|nr:hypothetical protein [Methylomonas sp.]MCK9608466.1 hypothetical protein [Methylomonas sp.]